MSDGFKKFKKRIYLGNFIKSLILALSVGSVTASVLDLLSKREIISLELVFSILIGAAVAAVLFTVMFLILLPNNKKVAKKLDSSLSLNEKVQTMIEFEGCDGEMIELQRNDTAQKLSNLPAKKFKIRGLLKYAIVFVIAVTLTVTASAIPAKEPEAPPVQEEIPYEFDEFDELALKNLIEYVKATAMEPAAKDLTVAELEALLAALYNVDTENGMKALVTATMIAVDRIVDDANTYKPISRQLKLFPSDYSTKLSAMLSTYSTATLRESVAALRAGFAVEEGLSGMLSGFSDEINLALTNSETADTVALNVALAEMARDIRAAADTAETSPETVQTDVESTFDKAFENIFDALKYQQINSETRAYVIAQLAKIFGITELPNLNDPEDGDASGDGDKDPEDYEQDDDELDLTDGGYGDAAMLYGSNDIVYDIKNKEYIVFGKILGDYYNEFLIAQQEGRLSEEQRQILQDYFGVLFTGAEEYENKNKEN